MDKEVPGGNVTKPKLAITGGAGFIGSNAVKYFSNAGYPIHVVDCFTYAGDINRLDPKMPIFWGEISAMNWGSFLSECKPDVIVNYAAESVTSNTIIPIYDGPQGIQHLTIKDFFKRCRKHHKIEKQTDGVEVINIPKGISVFAFGYHAGMATLRHIDQISRHKYKGKIIKLSQSMGEIFTTPNHSVYNTEGVCVHAETDPEILGARRFNMPAIKAFHKIELKTGRGFRVRKDNRWLYSTNKEIKVKRFIEGKDLERFMAIAGAFISEGSVSFNTANGSYVLTISNKDILWLARLKKYFERITNAKCSIIPCRNNVWMLSISSKLLFCIFENLFGKGSKHKRMPSFIFGLARKYQLIFWKNLVKGDGSICRRANGRHTYRYATVSKMLACQLCTFLSLLKKEYTVNTRVDPNGINSKVYNIREVCRYNFKLAKKTKKTGSSYYEGYVYDLGIAGTHNFIGGFGNIVLHNTHVDRSLIASEGYKFVRANVTGVHRIISEIRKYQLETKKKILLIHISTDEVLGDIPLDKHIEYSEEQPLHPNNFYAATKASAELIIQSMYHTYKDFEYIIARASNNYGPNQHQEKFIPTVISRILKGQKVPVYGTGDNVREWLWVDDFTRGIELIIQNYYDERPIASEIFHFGSSTRIDNISLVNMIIALMDASPELTSFVADRPGHDKKYALSSEKAKQILGWAPAQTLEKGLAEVIKDIQFRVKKGYIV